MSEIFRNIGLLIGKTIGRPIAIRSVIGSIPQYSIFTDGTTLYRKGIRDGYFVLDVALTDLGFSGVEDTDWENCKKTLLP